ncbi:hypothetical protein X975_07744, partial [Stegodyphus mimosarum]
MFMRHTTQTKHFLTLSIGKYEGIMIDNFWSNSSSHLMNFILVRNRNPCLCSPCYLSSLLSIYDKVFFL